MSNVLESPTDQTNAGSCRLIHTKGSEDLTFWDKLQSKMDFLVIKPHLQHLRQQKTKPDPIKIPSLKVRYQNSPGVTVPKSHTTSPFLLFRSEEDPVHFMANQPTPLNLKLKFLDPFLIITLSWNTKSLNRWQLWLNFESRLSWFEIQVDFFGPFLQKWLDYFVMMISLADSFAKHPSRNRLPNRIHLCNAAEVFKRGLLAAGLTMGPGTYSAAF